MVLLQSDSSSLWIIESHAWSLAVPSSPLQFFPYLFSSIRSYHPVQSIIMEARSLPRQST